MQEVFVLTQPLITSLDRTVKTKFFSRFLTEVTSESGTNVYSLEFSMFGYKDGQPPEIVPYSEEDCKKKKIMNLFSLERHLLFQI